MHRSYGYVVVLRQAKHQRTTTLHQCSLWQFLRLHALGRVPVVKAHADIEIVPNVIVILLGTIKNAYRHLGHACEMDRELRLDHTSSAGAWVGILVNTWQGVVEHLWPLVMLHRYFAILAGAVQV
jgi:hypothetical protein